MGMIGMGLKYDQVEINLRGYLYFDWAGRFFDRKSTTRCYFNLGSTMIYWFCRKKSLVSLSSTEEEYIDSSMGSKEVVWLRKFLVRFLEKPLKPIVIHCDNKRCIKLSINLVSHNLSKHTEIPCH